MTLFNLTGKDIFKGEQQVKKILQGDSLVWKASTEEELGPNLLLNGNFENGTEGWYASGKTNISKYHGSSVIEDGVAINYGTASGTNAGIRVHSNSSLEREAGKQYKLSFEFYTSFWPGRMTMFVSIGGVLTKPCAECPALFSICFSLLNNFLSATSVFY